MSVLAPKMLIRKREVNLLPGYIAISRLIKKWSEYRDGQKDDIITSAWIIWIGSQAVLDLVLEKWGEFKHIKERGYLSEQHFAKAQTNESSRSIREKNRWFYMVGTEGTCGTTE